jgi:hypothetical protein
MSKAQRSMLAAEMTFAAEAVTVVAAERAASVSRGADRRPAMAA